MRMGGLCLFIILTIIPSTLAYISFVFAWQNPDQHRDGADDLACYLYRGSNLQDKWQFYEVDQNIRIGGEAIRGEDFT